MKLTKAEQEILWNRVDQNIQLVDKITHDAQQTIQKKINLIDQTQLHNVGEKATSPLAKKNFKISKKLIALNFKQEQEKANLMRNKMAYMHLTQYKQQKAFEIAKRNLTRIANIRLNSLRERQNLSKLRQSLCLQQYQEKQMKAREIKSSRKTRQKAIQSWKNTLKQTAQGTRAQKNMYHTISCQQKKLQHQINLQKASNVKKSLEKSRLSIQQAASMKIQITKQRYQYDLQSRYQMLSSEKKKNEKLYQIFKSETEKANDWQQQKKKQINHFRSLWIQNNENPETISLEQF